MSREIDGATKPRTSPEQAYYDGYRDGYNKALEIFQKEIQMAYLSRPIEMKVVYNRLESEKKRFKAKGVEMES